MSSGYRTGAQQAGKLKFKCTVCGEVYDYPVMVCALCRGLVRADYPKNPKGVEHGSSGVWYFKGALPALPARVTLSEGRTPMVESTYIGRGKGVFFKDEGRNPTGSVRDRAAAVVISHAVSGGYGRVVVASDGNMGVSIAAYAAKSGVKATVYTPPWIDSEKAILVRAYGARLLIEERSIDALLKAVEELSKKQGYYNASTSSNPLSIEGVKTVAYEIYAGMGKAPKRVYVPLGSGVTLLSLYYGFSELREAGLVPGIPELVGVEHCGNPKYAEHLHGVSKCREEPYPGLRYYTPAVFNHVVKALEQYGDVVTVASMETLKAAKLLATKEGLFTELSSAVAVAGYLKREDEDSVVILFSHGVKSAASYAKPSRRRFTTPYVGVTKKLVIEVVRLKPGLAGYEIWRELGLNVTPQAVYQHLRELVEMGFLEVRVEGGVRRYYARRLR